MPSDLDVLRDSFSPSDYVRIKHDYIDSLENLNIEQLTLLEYASYEYQSSQQMQDKGFPDIHRIQEEACRSKIRDKRRSKLEALIRDIIDEKQSIYGICNGNEDPYFLLKCFFRLSGQYENTNFIPKKSSVKLGLLKEAFDAIQSLLIDPTQEARNNCKVIIQSINNQKIRNTLEYTLEFLTQSYLKIQNNASELTIKSMLSAEGRGYIADLIFSVYEGQQQNQIIKANSEDWEKIIEKAKRACFKKLGRENEIQNYALTVYVNDYPGTIEGKKALELTHEGESIGLGVMIALNAYLKNHKIKQNIAFTGEIDLETDLVRKVGGFTGKSKAYAACWSGIEKIIIPNDNVDEATLEIKRAQNDRSENETAAIGVKTLAEAEEAIFQSVISVEFDEEIIRRFPFPIARKYEQILLEKAERKDEYIYQTIIVALQYLSLILVSQYTMRDTDKEHNPELSEWLGNKLGDNVVPGTWAIALFKLLKHYLGIPHDSGKKLFIQELYNIPENYYDHIQNTIQKILSIRYGITENLPTSAEDWQGLVSGYTDTLRMVLETFSFVEDYLLIRIVSKQDGHYRYHKYIGVKADNTEYEFSYPSEQELILGQIYLAKPDFTDFLHLDPMLIFWSPPIDVLMYHKFSSEKVSYRPSFISGLFDTTDHLSEIMDIYKRLSEKKEKKPSFNELGWEMIRENAYKGSSKGDFDKITYLQRKKTIAVLQEFLKSDKNCLIVSGNAGSGKTSFLCSLATEFHDDQNVCVLVYPSKKLADRILEAMLSDTLVLDDEGDKNTFLKRLNGTHILDNKKLIICIDAINEHDTPKELLKSLEKIIEKSRYPWFKMIITCRTNVWKRLAPPTVPLTEDRYYRIEDTSDIAIYMQDFEKEELSEVYEKYRIRYSLKTDYDNLGSNVKRIIRDPLMLSLIAESHENEAIPDIGLSNNSIYQKYITKLEADNRLDKGKDKRFLVEQLVPLMAENGNYANGISVEQIYERTVFVPGLGVEVPLIELMYSCDEEKLKTPYIRLLDAGILKEEGETMKRIIQFRIERLYEFFLGGHIQKNEIALLKDDKAKIVRFYELIAKAIAKPYLWGVVRQALIMDDDKEEILKYFVQTSNTFERNMVVDCLLSIAENERNEKRENQISTVCNIVSELISLKGKDEASLNSKTAAIQVAYELCRLPDDEMLDPREKELLLDVMIKSIYDKNQTVCNKAYEYIYYLSIDKPSTVLKILEEIGQKIRTTWRIAYLMKSLEACGIISLLIYCDVFKGSAEGQVVALETVTRLQKMWQGIIQRCKSLIRLILWGGKPFLGSLVQKDVGKSDVFNRDELNHFFTKLTKDERHTIIDLTPYLKLEKRDLSLAEDKIIKVAKRSDVLSFFHLIYVFIAQASIGNVEEIFRIVERIYHEGSEFSKALCELSLSSVMRVNNSQFNWYKRLVDEYISNTEHWEVISDMEKEYCIHDISGLIVNHKMAGVNIDISMLEKYLEKAGRNSNLLLYIIEGMRASIIYDGIPLPAIEVLKRIIHSRIFAPEVKNRIIETLIDVKIYHPELIKDLLEEIDDEGLSKGEKEAIRNGKSSELLGHLLGIKLSVDLIPAAISMSPGFRNAVADVLAAASKCRNLSIALDQILRRLLNYVAGEEILKVIKIYDEK